MLCEHSVPHPEVHDRSAFSHFVLLFLFSFWWGTVSLSKLAHVHIVNHL